MKRRLLLIIVLLLVSVTLSAQTYDIVVAKDGSGDYTTIQAAVDACPDNERKVIFIKPGLYEEKVMIGSHSKASSQIISLTGEDPQQVVITWDDYNGKSIVYDGKGVTSGTPQSATMTINASDFYAENITFQNTYTGKQAVALYNAGDRQVFKNCRITGYQDTHYLKKGRRSYFYNCYIEGGTDYICAGGTAVFDNCTLHSLRNGSYITAAEDITAYTSANGKRYYYGFIFRNCTLISSAGIEVFLGRPWQETSSSVFIGCKMQNIKPEGWSVWQGNNNHLSAFFAEYQSLDSSGNLLDVSNRVSWSYQLSAEEVETYYTNGKIYSFGTGVFDPIAVISSMGMETSYVARDKIKIQDNILYLPENKKCRLYSIAGLLQSTTFGQKQVNLSSKLPGIYVVELTTSDGRIMTDKIVRTIQN
ncbi:MAG: right-handed parallel beta-helix repeat-containing protein [Dysgonamonadaceae bacterium]|jgi:pectinesterase|nr:right-handed parallel beta-helix repeat-containing protein [Dysgonamonadaceae bacterium]